MYQRYSLLLLLLLLCAGGVGAVPPDPSHYWNFRNCVAGQNVGDTVADGGITATLVNVSSLFRGCDFFILTIA